MIQIATAYICDRRQRFQAKVGDFENSFFFIESRCPPPKLSNDIK